MKIELCCAEEVAHALGIKLDTLYRYARKGRIRGMKIGKSWRFFNADIQNFLQQNQYNAKSAKDSQPPKSDPPCWPIFSGARPSNPGTSAPLLAAARKLLTLIWTRPPTCWPTASSLAAWCRATGC